MFKRTTSLLLLVALLGVASNQAITRGYIYSNIGTLFSWSGAAQSWSGSTQVATCSDYTTYIHNDGTACTSTAVLQYGFATTHAVNGSPTHSPILANNTFAGGSLASWSSTNASSCAGGLFNSSSTSDEDGDNGLANATSLGCTATAAQVTLAQTFTTGGAPTSQTYSFWYRGTQAQSGDATNCTQATGTASLALKIGSTTIATISSPTLDGLWHQATGSMSAMVSGSNTLTLTATLAGARGQYQKYDSHLGEYICVNANIAAQQIQVDNFVLSGVW